jgi:spore coat protein U-like protein
MFRVRSILFACALTCPAPAFAATTVTNTFNVTMTITAQCMVTNPTTMAFASTGLLSAAVNQTSSFNVTCTNTTPYNIGLDAGANASSGQRRMKGGSTGTEYISYNLYQDAGYATPWGNVIGTSTKSATGTGSTQAYTVYGQVPAQATPSPAANYTDMVTINVTY